MAGLYFKFVNIPKKIEKHFYFEGGIRSLVSHLNMAKKPLHKVFYINNNWQDPDSDKQIGVEVALQYADSFNERLESYVNVIHTPDGGAHLTGFRMGLNRVLKDYANKNSLLKEKESFSTEDLK